MMLLLQSECILGDRFELARVVNPNRERYIQVFYDNEPVIKGRTRKDAIQNIREYLIGDVR